MAGEAEVKQKIVLEGEKEYNRAIKDAQRNLRTLRSELKMETAELGRNATEQQKNETKAKSLKKQIQEQEKVVQACQKALDEVREKYGDNAEAMATYEQKVNQARTTLANMRNALDGVSESFEEVGSEAGTSLVETRSFAESIESLGNAADAVSSAIEGIFAGMIDTVKSAITTVWGDMVDLAARANSWIDLAGFWNTDAATVQKWAHAVGYASGTLEDINAIVNRINSKDNKDIASLTGISKVNYEDDWQYAMAVMDAMSKMEHRQRNEAAYEIFGRNPGKALDLLNDWGNILDHLDQFDTTKGGVGMSDEDMETMSALYDQVNGINETWKAFKDSFMAGAFGKLSLDLAGDAQGMLDSLIAFMSADSQEERDQAISDLETHMTDFFTRLGEAITEASSVLDKVGTEMEGSENGGVRAVGTVLRAFSDVLEWFTDENNIDKVIHGFEMLAAVWAGAKMLSAVATLSSLAANITTIKNGGGILGALLGRGVASTAGNAAATAASGAAAAGGTGLGALAGKALGTLAKVAPWAAGLAVLLDTSNHGDDSILDASGNLTETAKKTGFKIGPNGEVQEPKAIMEDNIIRLEWPEEERSQEQEEMGETISQAQRDALEDWWDLMRRAPEDDLDSPVWDEFDTMWPELEALFSGNLGLLTELDKRLDEAAWGSGGEDWRSYEDIPASVFEGITTAGSDMNGASRSLDNATATMRGLPALLRAAVQSGVSNIVVSLDGQKVGSLITPYVSQGIAREIQ